MRISTPLLDITLGFGALSQGSLSWGGACGDSLVAGNMTALASSIVAWNAAIDTYLKGDLAKTEDCLKVSSQLELSINMTATAVVESKQWNKKKDSKALVDLYSSLGGNVTFVTGKLQENTDALIKAKVTGFLQEMLPPIETACDGFADTLTTKTGKKHLETIQSVTASIDTSFDATIKSFSLTDTSPEPEQPQSGDCSESKVTASAEGSGKSEANVSATTDGVEKKAEGEAKGDDSANVETSDDGDNKSDPVPVDAGDEKADTAPVDDGKQTQVTTVDANGSGGGKADASTESDTAQTKITTSGTGDSKVKVSTEGGSVDTQALGKGNGDVKVEATPDGKEVTITGNGKGSGDSSVKVEANGPTSVSATSHGSGSSSVSVTSGETKTEKRSEASGFVYLRRSVGVAGFGPDRK